MVRVLFAIVLNFDPGLLDFVVEPNTCDQTLTAGVDLRPVLDIALLEQLSHDGFDWRPCDGKYVFCNSMEFLNIVRIFVGELH